MTAHAGGSHYLQGDIPQPYTSLCPRVQQLYLRNRLTLPALGIITI